MFKQGFQLAIMTIAVIFAGQHLGYFSPNPTLDPQVHDSSKIPNTIIAPYKSEKIVVAESDCNPRVRVCSE